MLGIKKIFTDSNNEDLLHDFISSLLEIPYNSIKKIEIQNPEIYPDSISGKFSRLDLKLQVDDTLINVELQVREQQDYKERALFYWSKLYTGDLKIGDEYDDLKQSISVNIINFNMFDCPDYHSIFKLRETARGETLSDKCAIHFFELKKINKQANKNNRQELWLQLINAESEEELEMLEQTGVPEIRKAVVVIHEMSEDERVREIARLREKALHDEATAMGHAKREGIQQGIQEGIQEGIQRGMQEMIEKMKKDGMSEEEINRILKR